VPVTEMVVSALTSAFTEYLKEKIKKALNKADSRAQSVLEKKLLNHIESMTVRFQTTKTILRGSTPVQFYEIYYPLTLVPYRLTTNFSGIRTNSAETLFCRGNKIALIGDAGSGKSTLSKHLFLRSIKEKFKIPIFIELRNIEKYEGDLFGYIQHFIFENTEEESSLLFKQLLDTGQFLFFFDGLDETSIDSKNSGLDSIVSFIERYRTNSFFLTSRPNSNAEVIPDMNVYSVGKFYDSDISNFVLQQLNNKNDELAKRILDTIREDRKNNRHFNSFLSNPLLLSLFILTYQSDSSVPENRSVFYQRVINVLFSEHDSKTKFGYQRNWESNFNQKRFEETLQTFCFISYMKNIYDFDFSSLSNLLGEIQDIHNEKIDIKGFANDMVVGCSLWLEDAGIYSFTHLSIHEYFAAIFIKNLKETKKKAYDEIIKMQFASYNAKHSHLLSLCEEVDSIDYGLYYLAPVMNKFLEEVDKNNLSESIFRIVFDGVLLTKKKTTRSIVRKKHAKKLTNETISFQLIKKKHLSLYLTFLTPIIKEFEDGISLAKNEDIIAAIASESDRSLKDGDEKFQFSEHPEIEKLFISLTSTKNIEKTLEDFIGKIVYEINLLKAKSKKEREKNESIIGIIRG